MKKIDIGKNINEIDIETYQKLNIQEKINFFTNKIIEIIKSKNKLKISVFNYTMTDPEIKLVTGEYQNDISSIIEQNGWTIEYIPGPYTYGMLKIMKR